MSERDFHSKRMGKSYRQTIEAEPDVVFPLLCPVREVEWLDGWKYTMLYSNSGLVEEGAVFRTKSPGEEDTVWVVTRHDPAARRVEFTRFTPRSKTCVLRQFLDSWPERPFQDFMVFWERSMNHFLTTGTRLPRAAD
jgi:hypothetical protein